ncbi:MAG TPA: tetratricopeptide repeat protein [Usitatibacter sp.]|nr:tetratricopeptide repeat protein [Usitatibacter sp.]
MNWRARYRGMALVAIFSALSSAGAFAQGDDSVVENARRLLAAGNAKQAYQELSAVQDKMSGMPEFDYLLGVASLDSGHIDDAIIAFERVLAVVPGHAGAQMDLARAYYAAGSFDLAEAAFLKLQASNPPPAAQIAINRYLETLRARRLLIEAGWSGFGELAVGYDSNITGVPGNFGAAAAQSFNIIGITATGNAVKRDAPYTQGAIGGEYHNPLSRGWSWFAGGEARGRYYFGETDFNIASGEVHGGAALNAGDDQYRITAAYAPYNQKGDAPGDPQPTNDRRIGGASFDWRHSIDPRTQVGLGIQFNDVRFPTDTVENFQQVYLAASYLKTYEGKGSPLMYLTGFVTDDHAKQQFDNGVNGQTATKSKNLLGGRSFFAYAMSPKLQAYGSLSLIYRKDKDDYARSTVIQNGHDLWAEIGGGLAWQFREKCTLRVQYFYSNNNSNIDIYDYNRSEVSSAVRCDLK